MESKVVSAIVSILLLTSILTLTFDVQQVKASETVYTKACGSSNSSTSPLLQDSGVLFKPPATQWNRTYGGADSAEAALSVVQTSDGGYALSGIVWPPEGQGDAWLVKVDSSGYMEWNITFGNADEEEWGWCVVQTSDGGIAMAGDTNTGDFFLVKTNATGDVEWSQTYAVASIFGQGEALVQTSEGGYALAGQTSYLPDEDFLLIKTNATGDVEWSQTYVETGSQWAESVVQTSDGGYAIAGITWSSGSQDFWLVKTNSTGDMEWSQAYGGGDYEVALSVVQTSDGGYALAGGGVGYCDFLLVKTDSTGNMEWNQTYGGTGVDLAWSMVQTKDEGYAIVGQTDSFGAGGYDFWLVKTDSTGNMEWNQTYGGTSGEVGWCVVQTSDGGYALGGQTASFGPGAGVFGNFWLVKVAPLVHDAAITDVSSLKTVVGQGYCLNVSVTAANQGDRTETFNVTIYGNADYVTSQNVTLASGSSETIILTWNTTGWAKGYYTISAYAWPVADETDTSDNNGIDGTVFVTIPGDVTGDKKVDGKDITLMAVNFGKTSGFPPNADITNDGKIDGKDITIAAKNFGKTWT